MSQIPGTTPFSDQSATSRWLAWASIAATVAIFGGTVWFVTAGLERRIREQIVARDAEILHAIIVMQQLSEKDLDPGFSPADEASQFRLLLQATRLKGVIGVRLFDRNGRFVTAFPEYITEGKLTAVDVARLTSLRPVSRFEEAAPLSSLIAASAPRRERADGEPLLEVAVPIHEPEGNRLLGVTQFLMDGQSLAARLASLHAAVKSQAWLVFVAGSVGIAAGLGWTLRRLEDRTERLARANRQLALAAKTAAVGAISLQLIHSLKSPLFGLRSLMAGRGANGGPDSDPAWPVALRTVRQLQDMIHRVVGVLRDQHGLAELETSLSEVMLDLLARMGPPAREAGVRLQLGPLPEVSMPSQTANLMFIVLTNLVENAVKATPRGGKVELSTTLTNDGALACRVRDEGCGIPPEVLPGLFLPCESTTGGGGIGLSICKQLVNHLEGRLELRSTSPSGSVFALQVPLRRGDGKPEGKSPREHCTPAA